MHSLKVHQIKMLNAIGELQQLAYNELAEVPDTIYDFIYNEETHIINPTLDETGRFEVCPIEYYGKDFLESNFMELLK